MWRSDWATQDPAGNKQTKQTNKQNMGIIMYHSLKSVIKINKRIYVGYFDCLLLFYCMVFCSVGD